ncbi:MAG: hypothetical protein JNM41_09285 [Flavipsychrobacter sp.]|nr:hypothetical protein [Flavipsychrobacter sp.]
MKGRNTQAAGNVKRKPVEPQSVVRDVKQRIRNNKVYAPMPVSGHPTPQKSLHRQIL